MNMHETEHYLFHNLPFSISVLEEWKKHNQPSQSQAFFELPYYAAVRNERFEWLCYLESFDHVDKLLKRIRMKAQKDDCRIIVYSKEMAGIESFEVKDTDYHIWLEDFMVCKEAQEESGAFVSAAKSNIRELARLQRDYCLEEINWSYYHTSLEAYVKEYEKKIKTGVIFLEGNPIKAKVEVSAVYEGFSKVNSVYTRSEFRQQGFATRCIRQAVTWAVRNRLTLCLNVREDNPSAIRAYEKAGFSKNAVVLYLRPAK